MMGLGLIWMFLFWGGLILLAVWIIGNLFPTTPTQPPAGSDHPPTAQEILNQRYARGELTPEQYQDMRHTLQQ